MNGRISYIRARVLLLVLGGGVAIIFAVVSHQRGAAPTEVLAPLLILPVFAAAMFWRVIGGLAAAAGAGVVYVSLLADQLAAIGLGNFLVLAVVRVAMYVFFALLVAYGMRYVENRLLKLEIYDQIDDLTGLYNASFLLQNLDLEASRSDRYRTLFSVVVVDVPRRLLAAMPRRRRTATLKDLATRIAAAVRTVDRVARIEDGDVHRFVAVLPETSAEGARIFAERLREGTAQFLASRFGGPGDVSVRWVSYPDDPAGIARLREEVALADARRRTLSDQA